MKTVPFFRQLTIDDIPSFSKIVTKQKQDLDADQLKDEAIQRVRQNADPTWRKEALDEIFQICLRMRLFSANDCWLVIPSTRENRALGALLQEAQTRGWCEATDVYVKSELARQHGRPIRQWRSKLC